MLYPVYVYLGNDVFAHEAVLPDFGDYRTASLTWNELPDKIQFTAECYIRDNRKKPNVPSSVTWLDLSQKYIGGFWMMADILFYKAKLPEKDKCTIIQ